MRVYLIKIDKYLHTTSLVKYPVFDKGKNYSGANILKKKILLDFIEKNFLKELKTLKKSIIVPLGNTVSSTIEYLNSKYNLKLTVFLKGFLIHQVQMLERIFNLKRTKKK